MTKRVTLKEIALETGLSIMTVSKYVNGIHIREENAKLIESVLKRMRYEPNVAARNLRMNRSMTIGVLISSLSDLFSARIAKGAEQVLVEKGFGVIVCDYYHGEEMLFEERLRFLRSKQIDGLISMGTDDGGDLLALTQQEIPVVQVDYPLDGFDGDVVACDNREASYRIVCKALEKGYRRIAIIVGRKISYTTQECLRGYQDAMEAFGAEIPSEYITYGDYSAKGSAECTKQLLALENRPEVIYVTNDAMARGMLRVFQKCSMVAGKDIMVIGRDLLNVGDVYYPRITSIEQPLEKLGAETAKLLLRRIEGDRDSYPTHIMLHSELIEGKSL